jgi:hypothetical protein
MVYMERACIKEDLHSNREGHVVSAYYKQMVECRHLIHWSGSQKGSNCQAAKLEPNQRVTIKKGPLSVYLQNTVLTLILQKFLKSHSMCWFLFLPHCKGFVLQPLSLNFPTNKSHKLLNQGECGGHKAQIITVTKNLPHYLETYMCCMNC